MDRKYLHLCMHVQARGQCLWSSSLTMHLVFGESLSLTLKLVSLSKLESHWAPGVLCLLSLSSASFPVPFALFPPPPLCLPSHLHPPSRVIDTHSSAYLDTRDMNQHPHACTASTFPQSHLSSRFLIPGACTAPFLPGKLLLPLMSWCSRCKEGELGKQQQFELKVWHPLCLSFP